LRLPIEVEAAVNSLAQQGERDKRYVTRKQLQDAVKKASAVEASQSAGTTMTLIDSGTASTSGVQQYTVPVPGATEVYVYIRITAGDDFDLMSFDLWDGDVQMQDFMQLGSSDNDADCSPFAMTHWARLTDGALQYQATVDAGTPSWEIYWIRTK
jgi:predicted transcriptional regulator